MVEAKKDVRFQCASHYEPHTSSGCPEASGFSFFSFLSFFPLGSLSPCAFGESNAGIWAGFDVDATEAMAVATDR